MSPHFAAWSSASLLSSDLNWSYLALQSRMRKGRRLVTGYEYPVFLGGDTIHLKQSN
jgi:hypothetical protein